MEENDHGPENEICLRCAEPNLEGTSRCRKCGAPLDPSASTHPWELKTANHNAYAPAVSPRTKPIIFWGVWLYFGPSAYFAVRMLYDLILAYQNDPLFEVNTDLVVAIILPLAYGILSVWALWSVTKGYLQKNSSRET